MTKVIEAIFEDGVLTPLEPLELPERQRVELTVKPIDVEPAGATSLPEMAPTPQGRDAALAELFDEIDRMNLQLRIRMPTRDELHERG